MLECLDNAMRLDGVEAERVSAAKEEFITRRDGYIAKGWTPERAAAQAGEDLKALTSLRQQERYNKVLHELRTMREIRELIDGTPKPSDAVLGLVRFAEGVGYRGRSIQSLTQAYMDEVNANIHKALEATGLNLASNSRNPKLLENLIREKHGQSTGDALAKDLAKIIEDAENSLVREFNAMGGNIQILKNRGMPQSHNADELEKAGLATWKAFIRPLVAWHKITDFRTGKPFAPEAGQIPADADTDAFLEDVFNGILTRGWDDREPSMSMSGKAMYNQHAEHRVLHFKDGSAQIEYNHRFGMADPFTTMINGMHKLASDVAIMRVLGPNPNSGLEFARQYAMHRAAKAGDTAEQRAAEIAGSKAKAILGEITGAASAPENITMARFMNGTRAVLVSTHLGSAAISSVTDSAFIYAAARTVGMNPANVMSHTVSLMASQASRQEAARMGYIAETLADGAAGYSRFMGKNIGTGIPQRLANFTLRASGLNFLTDMRRISWQMGFSGHLAGLADRGFNDLPIGTRNFFDERGFTAKDWDALRHPSGRFTASGGADFITPHYWAKAQEVMPQDQAHDLAMRFRMALREHLIAAVPESTPEVRAMMRFGTKSGTIGGEAVQSAGLFKSFGVSVVLTQYRRFANAQAWGMNPYQYAIFTLGLPTVIMGALALQLRELAKGNDPRPMTSLEFWGAAVLQGGGFGIFGDFFSAQTNRFGGGFAQTLAGPVANLIDDVGRFGISNAVAAANGERTFFGRDAAKLVGRYTPVASSFWPTRAAYQRLMVDPMMAWLDPDGFKQALKAEKKRLKDFGTQSWAPRGGGEMRLPDLGNAFGG